jgi:hypothetical protein
LGNRAIETAFKQLRHRAVVVLEEQRLAQSHQEVDVVARVEAADAHRPQRRSSRREVRRVCAFTVALQVRASQHDSGRVEGRGRLLSRESSLNGGVKLPLIEERPRARQIRPGRQHGCGGHQDDQSHR